MHETHILVAKLIEHYDAVENLRYSVQVIGVLVLLLLIQTSRAAFHRGKYESQKRAIKVLNRLNVSHCEEITWLRNNADRSAQESSTES